MFFCLFVCFLTFELSFTNCIDGLRMGTYLPSLQQKYFVEEFFKGYQILVHPNNEVSPQSFCETRRSSQSIAHLIGANCSCYQFSLICSHEIKSPPLLFLLANHGHQHFIESCFDGMGNLNQRNTRVLILNMKKFKGKESAGVSKWPRRKIAE